MLKRGVETPVLMFWVREGEGLEEGVMEGEGRGCVAPLMEVELSYEGRSDTGDGTSEVSVGGGGREKSIFRPVIDDCLTGEEGGAGLGAEGSKEDAKGGREGASVQAALQSFLGKTGGLVGCVRFGSASRATKGFIGSLELEKLE